STPERSSGGHVSALQPGDVSGVRWRRIEVEAASLETGIVETRCIGHQDRQRPSIQDQVMMRPEQLPAGLGDADQPKTRERRIREIEALRAVVGEKGAQPFLLRRLVA